MIINGVELEDLDIYDLEVAEKYDNAIKDIATLENKVKEMDNVETMKTMCNAVFDVFNTMYGDGADKKIFGNKVNLKTCLSAFGDFATQMNEQKNELDGIVKKYSPNRANRRNKK